MSVGPRHRTSTPGGPLAPGRPTLGKEVTSAGKTIQSPVGLADTSGVNSLVLLIVVVLLALTLVVFVIDVAVVDPRCCRTIAGWASAHGYTLVKVQRQWVGRDVMRGADGTLRNVHSRPGGRYFVVSGTASSGMPVEGRLRIEGGFQGYGANEVVELVVHESDFDLGSERPRHTS
jgi:hypothetical protein